MDNSSCLPKTLSQKEEPIVALPAGWAIVLPCKLGTNKASTWAGQWCTGRLDLGMLGPVPSRPPDLYQQVGWPIMSWFYWFSWYLALPHSYLASRHFERNLPKVGGGGTLLPPRQTGLDCAFWKELACPIVMLLGVCS